MKEIAVKHVIKIYSSPCRLMDRVPQLFILETQFQSTYWQERIRVGANTHSSWPALSRASMCSTSRSGTCQGPILGASCWSSSIWGSARTYTPRCAPWRVWAHSSGMPAHARAVPASLLPCNAPVLGCPGGQRASGQPLCSSAAQGMGPGEENLQCSLQHCIPLLSLPSARSNPYINIHTDHQKHSNQDFAHTGVSGTLFQQLWDTAPSSLTSFPVAAQAAQDMTVNSSVFSSSQATKLLLDV